MDLWWRFEVKRKGLFEITWIFSGDSNTDPWESFWVLWFLFTVSGFTSFFLLLFALSSLRDRAWIRHRRWWIRTRIAKHGSMMRIQRWITENRNEIHKSALNCWFWKIRVPMWFCAFLCSLWNWNCFEDCKDSVELNCVWIEGFDGELKGLGFGEDEFHAKFLMNFEGFLQISEPWSNWQERENCDVFVWVGTESMDLAMIGTPYIADMCTDAPIESWHVDLGPNWFGLGIILDIWAFLQILRPWGPSCKFWKFMDYSYKKKKGLDCKKGLICKMMKNKDEKRQRKKWHKD
jgi:hypothetical protein